MNPQRLWAVAAAVAVIVLSSSVHAQQGRRVPVTAQMPELVTDLRSALAQTAVVVEGLVDSVTTTYSEEEGPWTIATIRSPRARMGKAPSVVRIQQFGGTLPNGLLMEPAHGVARLAEGERYIVFLRNTGWTLSPVVDERYAMRVVRKLGGDVVTTHWGYAITDFGPQGPQVGKQRIAPKPAREVFEISDASTISTGPAPEGAASGDGDIRPALTVTAFFSKLQQQAGALKITPQGEFFDLPPLGGGLWKALRPEKWVPLDQQIPVVGTPELPAEEEKRLPVGREPPDME